MTLDEVIVDLWAQGIITHKHPAHTVEIRAAILAFAAEQVAAEREACAELCDAEWNGDSDTFEYTNACNDLAEAIRARAQEE